MSTTIAVDVERVVDTTLALAVIPAPTGDETARGDEVARRLAALGLPVSRDEAGNVVATAGPPASAARPAVVVSAHLDTVFDATVPLVAERRGDRLHGPGIGDDTVAVGVLLLLAADVARTPPAVPVVLAATVGEEGLGDLRGAKHLLATVPAAAFVPLEGHLLDDLVVGGIGAVRLRASYAGPGGHSWGDRGVPSAVHAMLAAGDAAVRAAAGRHLNVGVAAGGTTVNAVAADASLLLDLRDEDARALTRTVGRVREALGRVPEGIAVRVDRVGDRPAGRTPAGAPLLAAARAARAEAGLPPARETLGSTESNAALPLGVPTVCLGVTRGGDVHRPEEWIEIPPLAAGIAQARGLLRRLAPAA